MIRHSSLGVFIVSLTLVSIAGAQSGRTSGERLDSIARANLAQDHAVGAVVGIVQSNDTLFFKSYGKMDVEADVPMPTNAIFGIGSITKQFTAAAILKLRDDAKLRLDDDLTKWLPDFDTRGNKVPLRRLLDHTSGIHDFTETGRFRELMWSPLPRDSIYAEINRYPFQFSPGAAQVYNNSAYWLLHLIIEKASGMSYQRYIESQVFEPLGMRDSTFCHSSEDVARRATGYHVRNGRVRPAPLNVGTWYLGSGVLCSTAEDLVTWLTALHGGTVVSPSSYADMTEPATLADGTRTRYAMGLQIGADAHGLDFIGHSGEIAGYGARANWYPEAQMAIVVLINNSGDVSATAMAQDLAAELLPVARREPRQFGSDVRPLEGTYKGPARGGDMVVAVRRSASKIAVSINGAPARPLQWVEGLTFREGSALLTFGHRSDGTMELRFDAGNGYYILERLPTWNALLARAELFVMGHWPLVLLGFGGFSFLAMFTFYWRNRPWGRPGRIRH